MPRAQARSCGGVAYPAAAPLRWNTLLAEVAAGQSQDVARTGALAHMGSDGSTLATRVDATGYAWRALGENIARNCPDVAAAGRTYRRVASIPIWILISSPRYGT